MKLLRDKISSLFLLALLSHTFNTPKLVGLPYYYSFLFSFIPIIFVEKWLLEGISFRLKRKFSAVTELLSSILKNEILKASIFCQHNPLSANPTKWSNTLKQFVGKLPTNCLSVFDHFVKLALKEIRLFSRIIFKNRFYSIIRNLLQVLYF